MMEFKKNSENYILTKTRFVHRWFSSVLCWTDWFYFDLFWSDFVASSKGAHLWSPQILTLPGLVAVCRTGGSFSDFIQPFADASVMVQETSSTDVITNRKSNFLILCIIFGWLLLFPSPNSYYFLIYLFQQIMEW